MVFATRGRRRSDVEEPKQPHPRGCGHGDFPPVAFDSEAARGLDEYEVRKRWPRIEDQCPVCGQRTIVYASFEHQLSGDW